MPTGDPTRRNALAVVLAAGEGTRMKSVRPKVLHEIAGRSMLAHMLASVAAAGIDAFAVVVGPEADEVRQEVQRLRPDARVFVQQRRLGTAHAVLAARAAIAAGFDQLLVLFADTPLVRPATIAALCDGLAGGTGVVALGFTARDPHGYGRLIVDGRGRLVAIREEKDASDEERRLRLCNAGLMAIDGRRALELLDAVGASNAKGEYYLTDIVGLAAERGLATRVVLADEDEAL
ncbi:MAG: NTP transferase domain-containing protein, partial [Methylocystis sp.]|nr:NTP transferase domain-containing protein [Methylocystis sp.]